jgi:hypothetical protein
MMHQPHYRWGLLLLGLLPCLPLQAAQNEKLRDVGRQLAKDDGAAIVNVQIIISQQTSYGGSNSENEAQIETSGTVIDQDGLTIVPLSAVDPSQMLKRFMSNEMGNQMNMNSRVKDIKLIVNKKIEIPATVVLRDDDLNIAYLRPIKKQATPFKAIDLDQTAEPRLLDRVCVLARMGRVGDREISVMTGEIQAIVNKPRKFYVPSSELASGGLGVPIFDQNGKFIGIVLVRAAPGAMEDTMGNMLGIGNQSGMLVIILPAKNIKEEAAQAPKEAPAKTAERPTRPAAKGSSRKAHGPTGK